MVMGRHPVKLVRRGVIRQQVAKKNQMVMGHPVKPVRQGVIRQQMMIINQVAIIQYLEMVYR